MGRLGHVPALDGLRGVAILLVVSVHFTGVPKGGGLGVDLFFVLSGFLITTLLLEERERDGRIRIRAFYERRARRLLPALAVLLFAFLAIDAAQGRNGLSQVADYGLYAGNAYEAFVSSISTPSLGLVHLWSLAQEEQFYLLWPLAFLLAVRSSRPARWLAALFALLVCYRIALVAHGAPMFRIDRGPDTQTEPLVAGCLIAFLRYQGLRWRPPPYLTVVAMATFVFGAVDFLGWYMRPLCEGAAAVLILAAVGDPEFARLVSWGWLRWSGRISYSLYLWHYVILWAFGWHERLLALAVSFLVAWLSYRYVERPFRRRRAPAPVELPAFSSA